MQLAGPQALRPETLRPLMLRLLAVRPLVQQPLVLRTLALQLPVLRRPEMQRSLVLPGHRRVATCAASNTLRTGPSTRLPFQRPLMLPKRSCSDARKKRRR